MTSMWMSSYNVEGHILLVDIFFVIIEAYPAGIWDDQQMEVKNNLTLTK